MSATSKQNETQTPPKAPYTYNPNYTIRVICCVLFIFLTEICLAHYIYRLINSEIRENYLPRHEVEDYVVKSVRGGLGREEIMRLVKDAMAPRKKRSLNNLEEPQDEGIVDFFQPNRRSELQAKDEQEMKKTGKGTAPGGDNWVWLTSYCRVTRLSIQGYCDAVASQCPPSTPGPKGPVGPKGERGDTGFPGIPGPMGTRGHQGSPGAKGTQGRPGLDGRDGVPGEPGFDGMPGRNGHDGTPGKDGLPGHPGRDGRNGTDGRPGLTGPPGKIGPQGNTGLTGPRGRSGRPGNHGNHGTPGILAYGHHRLGNINSTELLIPPSIGGSQHSPMGPIIIMEGDNVTMSCAVTGVPFPQVEWIRTDDQPITLGAWQAVSVPGPTLNITLVSRSHMAVYQCVAHNGVPPQVNQTFALEVHFAPFIRRWRDSLGAAPNTTATLECVVESFPDAIRYWERADGKILESGDKYNIDVTQGLNSYTVKMQLNISRVNTKDYSKYYCVAKNPHGINRGDIIVYKVDPSLATPPPLVMTEKTTGPQPPKRTSQPEICPPTHCTECVEPKELKCTESGVSLFDLIEKWEIRQFGRGPYPGLPNRTIDCVLYAVGKPVYHRFKNETNGCWMRDPVEKEEKYYATSEANSTVLLEYNDKSAFRKDTPSKKHEVTYPFSGNSHVVYNGSFYYYAHVRRQIIKLNLSTTSTTPMSLPTNISDYLYTTGNNYVDFSVDENGLWVIFGVPSSNNTAVMKLDSNTLDIQYVWNISLNHHKVGEMFVVCGVLYAVDSVTARDSRIRFALDLYKNTLLDVNLPFTNPFRNTSMVGYNHKNKELYTWDRGNQLTYPVRYHEIGYKLKDEHEPMEHMLAVKQTRFKVSPDRDDLD